MRTAAAWSFPCGGCFLWAGGSAAVRIHPWICFARFRTRLAPSSTPPPSRSAGRVQRPGVCVGAPCLAWSALAPGTACAAQSRPVLWMGLLLTGGAYRESRGWGSEPSNRRKNKKAPHNTQKPTLPLMNNPQNFPKIQKDPYKGSAFCAILALQALKGRNL